MSNTLFPFIPGGSSGEEHIKPQLPLFREYAYDGGVQLVDGHTRVLEGLPALMIWIRKALTTARFRYAAYSWHFGSELDRLTGEDYTPAVTRVEAERMVREALMGSPYIRSVGAVTTDLIDCILRISCAVDTVYGEVNVSV